MKVGCTPPKKVPMRELTRLAVDRTAMASFTVAVKAVLPTKSGRLRRILSSMSACVANRDMAS